MENRKEFDFLESLLDRQKITEKELVDYANEKHDEIAGIESVFELKTQDDFNTCFTIPYLLAPEDADDIIEYFKSEKQGSPFIDTAKPDLDKYRLMLAAAFAFNSAFFAMAWNWCALIKEELAKGGQVKKEPDNIVYFTRYKKSTGAVLEKRTIKSVEIVPQAAAGADPAFTPFYTEPIENFGLLEFRDAEFEDYYLQICFKPDMKLEKPNGNFTIKVEFLNKTDNKTYNIEISSDNEMYGWFFSDEKKINCTGGIIRKNITSYEE